jgi:protein-tyrosine phosphatase
LAAFAFFLFREAHVRLPVVPHVAVGCGYATGGALVLAAAAMFLPWGTFLLWPAASLAFMAAAYFGLGPGTCGKTNGRLPLSARFVLAPVLLGQHLSLAFYRRQCRAWDQAAPGVLIGRVLNYREAAEAIRQGVTAVLDLTGDFGEAAPLLQTRYRNLPILDLTAPTQSQLEEAVAFIQIESARGVVYVHCKIGYSRSAAVVAAFLLSGGLASSVPDAIRMLQAVRPRIVVRAEIMTALARFHERSKSAATSLALLPQS